MTRPFFSSATALVADPMAEILADVDLQDRTDTSAAVPGPLAPAPELGGGLLLEMKRPADALQAFEATLQKEPNCFRTVYGAASAVSLAGDHEKARRYYRQLLESGAHADVSGRAQNPDGRRVLQP